MINTVRLALPAEAVDIARIQRRAWGKDPVLAATMLQMPADEASRIWHRAITKAPLAQMRVLVAIGETGVAGFAMTQPSQDPDARPEIGEIAEFVIDDEGKGHDGRLINAAVDTLQKDGFTVARMWLPTRADDLRAFLTETGWGADGAVQEATTEDGKHSLKMVRLHTDITPEA